MGERTFVGTLKTEEMPAVDNLGQVFSALMRSGMFKGIEEMGDNHFTLTFQPITDNYIPTRLTVTMWEKGQFVIELSINDGKPRVSSTIMNLNPEDAVNIVAMFLVSKIHTQWRLAHSSTTIAVVTG